ncbi:hypothetical protein BDGGKGIB_04554 [Nodularia sphaerocarpa UHCC 0038]|nr:hypothetical protein BDGGKGIB_04554 [Nodularia sphaerocarpa UHCC 0038]
MATPRQGRTLLHRQSPPAWTNQKIGFLTRAGGFSLGGSATSSRQGCNKLDFSNNLLDLATPIKYIIYKSMQ